ncbi:ACP S-malonyltransferase, partial [candidate division KSB1 bacterium]|nr:ACP S-malonyltransferase [candidate division KSB1 bacterium]
MAGTAVIFPGQGSQAVGMGADIYQAHSRVRDLYAHAAELLGYDLAVISFNGPAEQLRQTRITQPALFVHSYALITLLQPRVDMMAGHSLGEFTAFTAAGAMSFEQGLKLVKVRAEQMQEAGLQQQGSMAAIIGLEYDQIKSLCEEASKSGIVVVANVNTPTQIVISGSLPGVTHAMRLAEAQGAKRAVPLQVSGAFHSPLMEPAREHLARALADAELRAPQTPVYGNVTASPCAGVADICSLLERQLVSPV